MMVAVTYYVCTMCRALNILYAPSHLMLQEPNEVGIISPTCANE